MLFRGSIIIDYIIINVYLVMKMINVLNCQCQNILVLLLLNIMFHIAQVVQG